jgi:hypothetical protein
MPCGELLKLSSLEPVSVGSVSVAAVLSFRLHLGRWSVLGVFQPEFHMRFAVSCPGLITKFLRQLSLFLVFCEVVT